MYPALVIRTLGLAIYLLISTASFAQESDCKCCSDKHADFDFWIGTWSVATPDGKPAGKNVITKIQDDCVLHEDWVSTGGQYTGTSNNFFNSKSGQWEQLWLDNQGGTLHLKGNKLANQMILKSDTLENDKGQPYFHRITWTDNADGTVRQYWEIVTNETEIQVAFDGLYTRDQ